MSTNNKKQALIFAPLPPPVGGIASITAMLYKGMANNESVLFENPINKDSSKSLNINRFVNNLAILFKASKKVKKGGRILFFSSAYGSFWEKLIWAYMLILLGKKPVIIMVDGNFPRYYSALSNLKKRILKQLAQNKSIVIGAQSETWYNYYSNTFPKANIETISASVDEVFFSLKPAQEKIFTNSITVLYIGWIIEDKGIIDLLDAIEMTLNVRIDIKFKLVGSLFNRDEFWANELSKRKINDITTFTGTMTSREAVLNEYANADIFVFPSHYEGFPVSLLEAIASGLPCVATNAGGSPDILDNGNAGIVVKPHSPNELSQAILKIAQDRSLRENFSAIAANRAKTKYSFEQFIHSYKKILNIND